MPSLAGALVGRRDLLVTADRRPDGEVTAVWMSETQIARGGFTAIVSWQDSQGIAEMAIRCGWDRVATLKDGLGRQFPGLPLPKEV